MLSGTSKGSSKLQKKIEENIPFSNHIFFGYRTDSWEGKWDTIIYVVNELCYA